MAKKRSSGRKRSGKTGHRAAWIGGLAVAGVVAAGAAVLLTSKNASAQPQPQPQQIIPVPPASPPATNPASGGSGGGNPSSQSGQGNDTTNS